ncbi:MAG: insulinase family protein [Candidatus Sumerlaeia bacterium]|nr:insulinase family protein [Candidatus Sumerlaeia bacterium]
MRIRQITRIILLWVVLHWCSCSVFFTKPQPVSFAVGKETQMKKFVLDNGLQVFIRENKGSKTVAIDALVNAGSITEPANLSGLSHFLEHMLFKGTEKYKVGEIDKIIEGVGAIWNAGTSEDFTHYYISVAAPYFDTCIEVMAEVLKNSIIDPEEVEKERLVILEEYRRKQDNPIAFLMEEVYYNSYARGPYKYPVLGTPATLNTITTQDLKEYYQRYYTPDNMVLVVIGDIIAENAIAKIQQAFADFNRKKQFWENDQLTQYAFKVRKQYEKQVGDTYMAMVFPAPGIDKVEEACVMDVLTTILGDGRSSRLYRNVKEKQQLVSSIGVSYSTQKLDSLMIITATLNPDKLAKTEQAILTEIKHLIERKVTPAELKKAKRMLTNGYYFATETNAGQSSIFGYYYILTGSTEFEQKYLERLQSVTAEQIQQVANRYLAGDYNLLYIIPASKSEQ